MQIGKNLNPTVLYVECNIINLDRYELFFIQDGFVITISRCLRDNYKLIYSCIGMSLDMRQV